MPLDDEYTFMIPVDGPALPLNVPWHTEVGMGVGNVESVTRLEIENPRYDLVGRTEDNLEVVLMSQGMLEITITKEKLLTKLKTNREKHAKVYEEAVEGFHDAGIKRLEEAKERLLARKPPENIMIHLPVPEDHTKDYDRLIEMIELSSDTEFDLNEQQAANYIMDEWHWTSHWLNNNAGYSETANVMLTQRG